MVLNKSYEGEEVDPDHLMCDGHWGHLLGPLHVNHISPRPHRLYVQLRDIAVCSEDTLNSGDPVLHKNNIAEWLGAWIGEVAALPV